MRTQRLQRGDSTHNPVGRAPGIRGSELTETCTSCSVTSSSTACPHQSYDASHRVFARPTMLPAARSFSKGDPGRGLLAVLGDLWRDRSSGRWPSHCRRNCPR